MPLNQEVIKSCRITLMVLILVLVLIVSVNAVCLGNPNNCPRTINTNLDLKKCVSSCIKDFKDKSKECDSNFSINAKKCRIDYSYCLNHAKDSTNKIQTRLNVNNCNSNYNYCRLLAVSIKNKCKNNISLYCNNKCIINSQNNQTNITLVNNSLFEDYNSTVGCDWRANITGYTLKCAGFEKGIYFDGNKCKYIHSCQIISNFPAGKRLLSDEECSICKNNSNN